MRILVAQLNPTVGDFNNNGRKIQEALDVARSKKCQLVLFSELAICGYPPEDLLLLPDFIDRCESTLHAIIKASQDLTVVVGTVRRNQTSKGKPLHNSAAIIENGKLVGFQDKCLLPTYDVFDEHRYFEPGTKNIPWQLVGEKVAITICEDIWRSSDPIVFTDYLRDPIQELIAHQPQLLLNLSSSPYSYQKPPIRQTVVCRAAKRLGCPAIFCNQVGANDSLIFDGRSLICNEKGELCLQGKRFEEELFVVDTGALPSPSFLEQEPLFDLYQALVLGVKDYFRKSGFIKGCIGLSGGIDSALAACIAVDALGKTNVLGISMPSRYSPKSSVEDAQELANKLGIELWTIPIEEPFCAYEALLKPHFLGLPCDVTEENLQARIRAMILMAISNKHHYIVLSTGNKSEMAMGFTTLYGDMCGGLAILSDVTKWQVYELARLVNQRGPIIPTSTLTKPPSAELRPNQKDSDTLPEYPIVDAVLEDYIEHHLPAQAIAKRHGFDLALVENLIQKIHQNEYKRRQAPPGLRVSEKAFSVGRRFPIVQRWH